MGSTINTFCALTVCTDPLVSFKSQMPQNLHFWITFMPKLRFFCEMKSTDCHHWGGSFFLSAPRTRGENIALSHTRRQVIIRTIFPPRVSHRPWLPGSPLKWTVLSDLFFFLRTCSRWRCSCQYRFSLDPLPAFPLPPACLTHSRWTVETRERKKIQFVCTFLIA